MGRGDTLKALQAGHRGLFIKAQDLFDEMYQSLADYSSRRLLNRLARLDLLVVDEMGYLNLRPEQSNIFFKLMEERYGRKATIITTNLDYDRWYCWYDFLGNKEMVGALLDRLRHRCHTVHIDGPSLRTGPRLERLSPPPPPATSSCALIRQTIETGTPYTIRRGSVLIGTSGSVLVGAEGRTGRTIPSPVVDGEGHVAVHAFMRSTARLALVGE